MQNTKINNPSKPRTWVIRAGRQGSAHDIFIKSSLVVLEHQQLGDLRKLPKLRKSFCNAYAVHHPDDGIVSVRGIGGKFYRFVHEIRCGDIVLYPCFLDENIYHGVIKGAYFYAVGSKADFPHCRRIQWKGCFPKNALSLHAKRELGAARTLFEIKTNISEIKRVIHLRNGSQRRPEIHRQQPLLHDAF
jgi:restriction system protein